MFERGAARRGKIRQTNAFPRAQVTDERLFPMMGEEVLFQTNDVAVLAIAEDFFGRFPPAPPSTRPPLILQLFVSEPEHTAPRSGQRTQISARSHGHLLFLTVGPENTLVADLERGYSFGYISPQAAQDRAFVRRNFIEAAAQAMLGLSRNFVAIHAACVVKNGRSLLLHGRAGLGKSTLAFACVRRGYQLLAEDVVQLKLTGDELRLWGIPWQLHLLPSSVPFFPELLEQQLHQQASGEWKLEVAVESFYPGATITNAPAGAVVLLDRLPDVRAPRIERISLVEAMAHFDVVWSWEIGWQDFYDERLRSLLANGAYRLHLGDTPDESVDVLEELLR